MEREPNLEILQADQVFGLKSYKDLRDVEGPVDPAVLAVPGEFVKETIASCGQKKPTICRRNEWR